MTDYQDELTAVENALRLLIERVGMDNLGISNADKRKWQERREHDMRERGAGFPEDRLLYYSDIADLKKIITRNENWSKFEAALLNRVEIEVFLDLLRRLRNPDAHNRELSTHELQLIAGIGGEIRTRITRYLSTMDTPESYFPRIISFQANLGTQVAERRMLRVGDELEFVIEATDPLGEALEFSFSAMTPVGKVVAQDWSANNRFRWRVTEDFISESAQVRAHVRSQRPHHAHGEADDSRMFIYTVLPSRVPKPQ